MMYGEAYGGGYGDPSNVSTVSVSRGAAGYLMFTVTPSTGLGDAWFGVFRNAKLVGTVYAEEGGTGTICAPYGTATSGSVLSLRFGGVSDGSAANMFVVRSYETSNSQRATIEFTWPGEVLGSVDGKTSNWSLTGVTYTMVERMTERTTWGVLRYDLVVSGATVAVAVRSGSTTLCSGSGTFPGTITLTGTSVSGSVDVAAGTVTVMDQPLYLRWASQMQVKRGATNPPTTVVDTVLFAGTDSSKWTDPSDLAAGTYYYQLQPVSDTGDTGTASSVFTGTIYAPPAAPTITGASGTAGATVVVFTPSATAGATYRVYLQDCDDDVVDLTSPAATGSASPITVSGVTGYPGTAKFIVRAVKSGVEESNVNALTVEYDASGNVMSPRPNVPDIDKYGTYVDGGRTLHLRGRYLTLDEKARATHLKLYTRSVGGSYDFGSPAATAALAATSIESRCLEATLNYTFPANGLYFVTIKAYVTSTGALSEDAASEYLINVSDVDAVAPTGQLYVSRG